MKPNYTFARDMARKVLKDYDLSEVPTDLLKVFQQLGLKYIELNDAEDIDGAILEIGGKPAIAVLNKAKPIPRQRFTLAHELGHIFLAHAQRDIYDPEEMRENEDIFTDTSKPPREKEADVFASELLMPCERLKENMADINNIEKLAGIFHVSRPAVTLAVANFWQSSGKKRPKF